MNNTDMHLKGYGSILKSKKKKNFWHSKATLNEFEEEDISRRNLVGSVLAY